MFKLIEKHWHGNMPAIEIEDATPQVHAFLTKALGACFVNDPFYKAKNGVNPFFQSGHENPEGGYILIEFWSSVDKAQKYVDFLNEQWNNNDNKEG